MTEEEKDLQAKMFHESLITSGERKAGFPCYCGAKDYDDAEGKCCQWESQKHEDACAAVNFLDMADQ